MHHRCECAFSFTRYYLNKEYIWNVFLVFDNVYHYLWIQTYISLSLSRLRQAYDQCTVCLELSCGIMIYRWKKRLRITHKLYELHYVIDDKNIVFFVVVNLKYDGNTSPSKNCMTTLHHHDAFSSPCMTDLVPRWSIYVIINYFFCKRHIFVISVCIHQYFSSNDCRKLISSIEIYRNFTPFKVKHIS